MPASTSRLLVLLIPLTLLMAITLPGQARPVQEEEPSTGTQTPTSTETPTPTETQFSCNTPTPTATTMATPILVSGGPGFLMVPSAAFQLISGPEARAIRNSGASLRISYTPMLEGAPFELVTPVYLPQGAKINRLVLYGYDDDQSGDSWNCSTHLFSPDVSLGLYRAAGGSSDPAIVALSTSGSPGVAVISSTNIASSVVDNQRYYYFLKVGIVGPKTAGRRLEFWSARIDYDASKNYLPLIKK